MHGVCRHSCRISPPPLVAASSPFFPLLPARFLIQYSLMIDTGSSNTGVLGYDDPNVGASYQR